MAKELLPLMRGEDLLRCVSCGDCVRACLPGALVLQKQEIDVMGVKITLRAPLLLHPEKCDHEGRCLVACSQKVFPCLWPQEVEEVRHRAEEIVATTPVNGYEKTVEV